MGRQVAFEIAYRITAGMSIMINLVRQLYIATLFTIVTTIGLGLGYPLLVTGASQLLFPLQANGSLMESNGRAVGSKLIGQTFAGPGLFLVAAIGGGKGL